jgi:hypothetical protein
MYSYTPSLTSGLDAVGGQHYPQPPVPLESDPVPNVQEVGWNPRPFWTGADEPRSLCRLKGIRKQRGKGRCSLRLAEKMLNMYYLN